MRTFFALNGRELTITCSVGIALGGSARSDMAHYEAKTRGKNRYGVFEEALVRWSHPWRGLLLPAGFLPLAEQTGVIIGVGHWVLREVCRQAKEWHERYPSNLPLTVSVKLSARQ